MSIVIRDKFSLEVFHSKKWKFEEVEEVERCEERCYQWNFHSTLSNKNSSRISNKMQIKNQSSQGFAHSYDLTVCWLTMLANDWKALENTEKDGRKKFVSEAVWSVVVRCRPVLSMSLISLMRLSRGRRLIARPWARRTHLRLLHQPSAPTTVSPENKKARQEPLKKASRDWKSKTGVATGD